MSLVRYLTERKDNYALDYYDACRIATILFVDLLN